MFRSYCERVFRDCRLQTCYVQSPAYPGVYPRNLHCRYHLNTRLPFIKLYIENEEFNIDGQRCENIMTCPMRPITSGELHLKINLKWNAMQKKYSSFILTMIWIFNRFLSFNRIRKPGKNVFYIVNRSIKTNPTYYCSETQRFPYDVPLLYKLFLCTVYNYFHLFSDWKLFSETNTSTSQFFFMFSILIDD